MMFHYSNPVRIVFGPGTVSQLQQEAPAFGRRALIVTGRSSTRQTGLLDRVQRLLDQAGVQWVLYDRITENPLTTHVEEGTALLLSEDCDFVIGLGGGSALDAAKGIAFHAINPGDISEYIFGKPGKGAMPIVAIPTTAGTGSEADSLAVLTHPDTHDKKSLKSPFIYPRLAIVDPELMMTLPRPLIASTGFDALTHCIEGFLSNNSSAVTDAMALHGITLLAENLPRVYRDPGNLDAWNGVASANTLGGMVIDTAGVTLPHALEHAASGLLNIRHGEGLAALYPAIMSHLVPHVPAKMAALARALAPQRGEARPEDFMPRLNALMGAIGLNPTLRTLGAGEAHIPALIEITLKTMQYAIGNHPVRVTPLEMKSLYRQALSGTILIESHGGAFAHMPLAMSF